MHRLQPESVWRHFATLCAIPRPSLKEATLRDHLFAWATARGVAAEVDAAGNLILRKPASPGGEAAPGVILQGHLDTVCQANAGTGHDFERDPIRPVVRDGWVMAEHTTLGADNGIGVALALAALEADDLEHPNLEVLLTVNEESGMDGARGLRPGCLQGRRLINLDTEEWGHFYVGCAGGVDVEFEAHFNLEPLPPGLRTFQIAVTGLRGGHSGIDIDRGRGNAIKLLVEVLSELAGELPLRLVSLQGGTARNAIPREAVAVVALTDASANRLDALLAGQRVVLHTRFADADPGLSLNGSANPTAVTHALSETDQACLLAALGEARNGVTALCSDFPGVVATSANLGVASLDASNFRATAKVRALDDGEADTLADAMISAAHAHAIEARKHGAYPGWRPRPEACLLADCQRVYRREFGQPASLQVIHAGLECGLLAASHPELEMISFGPDIVGAHAPGERVEIASVGRCWQLLRALLEELADAPA